MDAIVLESPEVGLVLRKRDIPVPGPGQALVRIIAASLNRRDYWMTVGLYPNIKTPCIIGSDGCGKVVSVGEGVSKEWLAKCVIINSASGWPSNDALHDLGQFQVLGMPSNGTFAEYCLVGADRLHLKPEHLLPHQAAALPLAGLTAYRALFVCGGFKHTHKVLVTGIGSGVALFVAQMAALVGAKVWVTSSKEEKIQRCKDTLGVIGGFNYTSKDWVRAAKKEAGGFDVIVDGSGGKSFGDLVTLLNLGGKVVSYGATAGLPGTIPIHDLFLRHKQIIGSTMGSDEDFANFLELVKTTELMPIVDSVRSYKQFSSALAEMKEGKQFGKIVLLFDEQLAKL